MQFFAVPGGVTLLPEQGEDAGKVQSVGARFSHGLISLEEAAELACRACASPGGGCQFLGTAATSQVVAEALGLTVTHSALAPSGQPIWLDSARRSARALVDMAARHVTIPFVAIGGIDLSNVDDVLAAGARMIGVVRACGQARALLARIREKSI